MTWWMLLFGGLGSLVILLFLGLPIFIAFLVLNVGAVLILFGPAGFGLFANLQSDDNRLGPKTAFSLSRPQREHMGGS